MLTRCNNNNSFFTGGDVLNAYELDMGYVDAIQKWYNFVINYPTLYKNFIAYFIFTLVVVYRHVQVK